MIVINANSINHAFKQGLGLLLKYAGQTDASRNGSVIRVPEPVTTVYANPRYRVLINPVRNANPFFHLMEALWMLAGRNDIAFVSYFNKQMATYSEDGHTQPGAYGYRWRKYFGYDQIDWIVGELKTNPTSRRCVLQMWDAGDWDGELTQGDLYAAFHGSKDVPCNTSIYFIIRGDGRLDMTVTCRSNDAIWGCYGANAVHMSILHEYMAAKVGAPMGMYYQVSNDLHAYTDIFNVEKLRQMEYAQPIGPGRVGQSLDFKDGGLKKFDADLKEFFRIYDAREPMPAIGDGFSSYYFDYVANPVYKTWAAYKDGSYEEADKLAYGIECPAWRAACMEWLEQARTKRALRRAKA